MQGKLLGDQWHGGLVEHDCDFKAVQGLALVGDLVEGLVGHEHGGLEHGCDHFEGLYGPEYRHSCQKQGCPGGQWHKCDLVLVLGDHELYTIHFT